MRGRKTDRGREVIPQDGHLGLAAPVPSCASLPAMLSRRSLLGGLSAATAATLLGRTASATVARAVSLSELVYRSHHAVLATPVDISSHWEQVGGRRRIVSYTVLQVEAALDGRLPNSGELVVRTLGGRVGTIGQIVAGEAIFRHGQPSASFLEEIDPGIYSVTAMAQGQYPVIADAAGVRRLRKSPRLPRLLRDAGAAVERLEDRTIAETQSLIFKELHPDAH